MSFFKPVLLGALLGVATAGVAQEEISLESDWLELVKGHKGESMGVELRDIEPGDEQGTRKVTLAVPKESVSHPDTIEEVVVVAKRPEEPEPIDIKYEWLDDYDNDHYGLVIHVGEGNWPIRLYMNSSAGFTRQQTTD